MGFFRAVKRFAVGSRNADTLLGSALGDALDAGSGNDLIKGMKGNDRILAGAGDDRAFGGAGNDKIEGGSGNDMLFGDVGNDTLIGGGGNDLLSGGAGNDTLNGGGGIDTAVFSGNRVDYDISFNGANVIVTHARGTRADGTDLVLASVEKFKFADQTINRPMADTIRPTATITVLDTALKAGETTTVTIAFSEAVTGLTLSDLTVEGGTLTALSSIDGIVWTATFTPNADLEDATNVITLTNAGIADLAGNSGVGTTVSGNYAIDTLAPTATIAVLDTALKAGETTTVAITFSEAVTGLTLSDLTIQGGTLTAPSSIDGIVWTATFTPNVDLEATTNVITLANSGVVDLAGNAGSGTTNSDFYAIDTRAPTATITVSDAALKAGETTTVTIAFSEAVTDLTVDDLAVENGGLAGLTSNDGGITWTATLTPTADLEDATNVVTLTNAAIADLAGNSGVGTPVSGNYAIDTLAPTALTITITSTPGAHSYQINPSNWLTVTDVEASAVLEFFDGVAWSAAPPAFVEGSNSISARQVDLAGNIGVSASFEFVLSSGTVIDGYIAGATVFADADGDGLLDDGEAHATTDASGNFTLIGGSGTLILEGGTDISTGLAFMGRLTAVAGSTTVTPLTTLVVALTEITGDAASAEALVIDALGLTGITGGLGNYDPIAAALSTDPLEASAGAIAVTAAITLQNTITQTSALLSGAGVDPIAAEAAALAAIASAINEGPPSTVIDLSDSAVVGSVIQSAADTTGATGLSPETIQGATSVIVATNVVASDAGAAATDPLALLTTLAQLQIVIGNEITASLSQAGEADDASVAVTNYTGTALDTAVDAVAGQVGDVDGADVGDAGDNTLTGTAAGDVIQGEGGDDTLQGLAGADTLIGGTGDDMLVGGAGADTYVWSQGDGFDTVIATDSGPSEDVVQVNGTFYDYNWEVQGNDLLIGVTTDDSYTFSGAGGALRLQNFFAGSDTISYLEADFGNEFNKFYNPSGGPSRIYFNHSSGADQGVYYEVVLGSAADDSMTGGGGAIDKFWGLDGNDTISVSDGTIGLMRGGRGNDTLSGADQNDQLVGGSGDDTLDGGTGYDEVTYNHFYSNDTPLAQGVFVNLSGAAQTRTVNGESITLQAGQAQDNWGDTDTLSNIEEVRGSNNDDTLVGSDNADVLKGLGGIDTLVGGIGDDTLEGGVGNDNLEGGAGVDTYVWSQGDGFDTVVATGSGPSEDVVQVNGTFYDYNWEVQGNDLLIGVAVDGNYNFNDIGGSIRLKDFLLGVDSISYFEADLGGFNQFYSPDGGPARIYYNHLSGVDQGNYQETIMGTGGADTMTGGGGYSDWFYGLDGDDVITIQDGTFGGVRAGEGDDTITGGNLDDNLGGGVGNDTISGGDGFDMITYHNAGGSLIAPIHGAFANLSSTAATRTLDGIERTVAAGQVRDNWGDTDTVFNVEAVRGSSFDDVMIGGAAGESLLGRGGADRLEGGEGNDFLQGGAGDDVLIGGSGSDTIDISRDAGIGIDTIEDFTDAEDLLDLAGFGFANAGVALQYFTQDGANVVFSFNGATAVLQNFSLANLDASDLAGFSGPDGIVGTEDPDELFGTTSDDVIYGLGGEDILHGDSGNDYLIGGEGSDTIDGGEGEDDKLGLDFDGSYDVVFTAPGEGFVQTGAGAIDVFTGIEAIWGTDDNEFIGISAGPGMLTSTAYGEFLTLVFTGGGDDQVFGSDEAELYSGGDGNDEIYAGGGDDDLGGEAGNDILNGGDGNDILSGWDGNDEIDGGDGDNDILELRSVDAGGVVGITFSGAGAGTVSFAIGDTDNFQNIEQIWGSDFDDEIVLSSGSGIGTVDGREGDDVIVGSDAGEVLLGSGGNDTLTGGGGFDIFDVSFDWESGAFSDIIVDFTDSEDVIALGSYGFADASTALSYFSDAGDDVVFAYAGATVTILNYDFTNFSQDDIQL